MGDLNSRRGKIIGLESRGKARIVRGQAPMAEMFGYATGVRSLTQGRATFTLQFSQYQKVPQSVFESLIKDRKSG
jgi:elongation factor G